MVPKNEAPDNTALQPIGFSNKSLTSIETHYSNLENDVLGTLDGLENFHHYWFVC